MIKTWILNLSLSGFIKSGMFKYIWYTFQFQQIGGKSKYYMDVPNLGTMGKVSDVVTSARKNVLKLLQCLEEGGEG